MYVLIIGTLDTKREVALRLKELIEGEGLKVKLMNVGVRSSDIADIDCGELAKAIGKSMDEIRSLGRREAIEAMAMGGLAKTLELLSRGEVSCVVGVGGGTGTFINLKIMRGLPIGVPKLVLSTIASWDIGRYIDGSDIAVLNSIADLVGDNFLVRYLLSYLSLMASQLAKRLRFEGPRGKCVAITAFGITTRCAEAAQRELSARGYEAVVFHAVGAGSRAMEALIERGFFSGVLDVTLHELVDWLFGGLCGDIRPDRLEVAVKRGLPVVVAPGGLDCIGDTYPPRVKGRRMWVHDFRSAVRTTPDELRLVARLVASKLNKARGPVKFMVPLKGWSEADHPQGPLYDPEANRAFIDELKANLRRDIPVVEVDMHINDVEFAKLLVDELVELIERSSPRP